MKEELEPNLDHARAYCKLGLHTCNDRQRNLVGCLVRTLLQESEPTAYSTAYLHADAAANLAHAASQRMPHVGVQDTLGARDRLRSAAWHIAAALFHLV
jgi:hypothetical protein